MTNQLSFCVNSRGEKIDVQFSSLFSLAIGDTRENKTSSTEEGVMSADLRDAVAFELGYSVPEVQAVFALLKNDRVLHIWTVVPEHDRTLYRRIYAKEKEIIGQFNGIDFDFNVVPSHGRDPKTLISDPAVQLAFIRK